MAQYDVTVTLPRRELARMFWPAAVRSLRDHQLFWNPRAWFFCLQLWLSLRFGGGS